jgi:hypothetical protein
MNEGGIEMATMTAPKKKRRKRREEKSKTQSKE